MMKGVMTPLSQHLLSPEDTQTIDRILDFSPTDKQIKLMQDLSLNLRAIISQRLIKTLDGGHVAAIEILINTLLISDLISK
jgi:twitching motility protein PilU